jgi:hypothetical protein
LSNAAFVDRLTLELRPDPSRVVIRPYVPGADGDHARAGRIASRVMELDDATVVDELRDLTRDFAGHHAQVEAVFRRRYAEVKGVIGHDYPVDDARALLIGAYFCQEYGYEAAALFNPSIVPHPDQSEVPAGSVRFVLSLRAVGEGHVSSIAFRTGLCDASGGIVLAPRRAGDRTATRGCGLGRLATRGRPNAVRGWLQPFRDRDFPIDPGATQRD